MISFKGISLNLSGRQKQLSRAQNALDHKVITLLEDYTPIAQEKYKNHGKMSRSHKQESPGVIINTEPKARREYYTNKGFSGINRGKFWLECMKADKIGEVKKAAAEELKK